MGCLDEVRPSDEISSAISLSPAQSRAFEELRRLLRGCPIAVLRADPGMGRSSVLRALAFAERTSAAFLNSRDLLDALSMRSPSELEEAFLSAAEQALERVDLLIWDDLHLLSNFAYNFYYQRRSFLTIVISAILERWRTRKRFAFGICDGKVPWVLRHASLVTDIGDFSSQDYAAIIGARIDYEKVFRHAPGLNAYQLTSARKWFGNSVAVTTDSFIEYLDSHNLTSNVDLEEVAPVSWSDLKGMDDIINQLEAKVSLPFENHELAAELDLKPKRGVLLSGPPGTGKTSIGRALAHRLKGKFFLVDGTVIAGSCDFYDEVEKIFEAAKRNAPAVIFVDDADVIFENGNDGFYRYLLTMLDGLATSSAQRVCVMLTAMEPRSLPAALLRSGRIELWLDTRLPDELARTAILREKLAHLPGPLGSVDIDQLAKATRGFTGADLKSVVEDGKLLYAHDAAKGRLMLRIESYFSQAIADIRTHRIRYQRPGKRTGSEAAIGFRVSQLG